jgi:hypothetical protein
LFRIITVADSLLIIEAAAVAFTRSALSLKWSRLDR